MILIQARRFLANAITAALGLLIVAVLGVSWLVLLLLDVTGVRKMRYLPTEEEQDQ